MSILLEKDIILSEKENDFFTYIQGNDFPWYYNHYNLRANDDNKPFTSGNILYTHMCMKRNSENKNIRGDINSHHLFFSEQFFMRVCKENDISVDTIFRVGFNSTFYRPDKHDIFHNDHLFKHKIFIFYINDFDNGSTFIKNDKEEITEIKAKKNKAIIFDGCLHAQGFCDLYQRRLILIVTFI